MKKRLILYTTLLLTAMLAIPTLATAKDSAEDILKAAGAKLQNPDGVTFEYTLTSDVKGANPSTNKGTMRVKGEKLALESPELQMWFDGRNQWTMLTGDKEVSLTEPTEEERQAISPSILLNLYRAGYKIKMKEDKLSSGQKGYKIFLTAKKKNNDIREMYVEVTADKTPVRISLRQGNGQWTRIVLRNIRRTLLPDSEFTFPIGKHPAVDIIDMR